MANLGSLPIAVSTLNPSFSVKKAMVGFIVRLLTFNTGAQRCKLLLTTIIPACD